MSDKNIHEWITDRPPTATDTSQRHYWCVDVVSRSGPVVGMRWDDAELQDFPARQTGVVAWRSPATPAESPDDWVTQDRVPARPGIDECRWFKKDCHPTFWSSWAVNTWRSHGFINSMGDRLEVRCLRKDLPPIQQLDALELPQLQRVTLWAPARLTYEGKDWPVRVSLGDSPQGPGSWVPLQWTGSGFAVEMPHE